jgi:hypothetical protein
MKTFQVSPYFICLTICIAIASCAQKKENVVSPDPTSSIAKENQSIVLQDTLSLAQFNDYTKRWARNFRAYMATDSIRYFTMPTIDLKEYVKETHTNTRFYIGMDANNIPHLLLTGTDGHGGIGSSNGNHIYDVTTACPRSCNDN